MTFSAATACLFLALVSDASALLAASGDLLWSFRDEERIGFCSRLAVGDGGVFTYLETRDSLEEADLPVARVRRFDRAGGDLVWETTDGAQEYPVELLAHDDLLISTSWLAARAGTSIGTVFTRARDAKTGDLVWMQTLGPGRFRYESTAMAADSAVTVVVGARTAPSRPLNIFDLFVAAYDTASGGLRWLDALDVEGDWDRAEAVAVGGGAVVVGGQITEKGLNRFFVRAYDARRGRILWEDRSVRGTADALVIRGGRVWVAGPAGYNFSDGSHVRSYDLCSGKLLWGRRVGDSWTRSIAILGKRVVVGGFRATGGRTELRAYLRENGKPSWRAKRMRRSTIEEIAAARKRIYGVGPLFASNSGFLGSWKGGSGRLRWVREIDASPFWATACSVEVDGDAVFVTGTADGPPPQGHPVSVPHQVVRAYAR